MLGTTRDFSDVGQVTPAADVWGTGCLLFQPLARDHLGWAPPEAGSYRQPASALQLHQAESALFGEKAESAQRAETHATKLAVMEQHADWVSTSSLCKSGAMHS